MYSFTVHRNQLARRGVFFAFDTCGEELNQGEKRKEQTNRSDHNRHDFEQALEEPWAMFRIGLCHMHLLF
ncbi:hypothetical protein SDC9_198665 [bioreactor metagenome]|uniref:Uncharacterized protein n=1 Tax=bioreactor metagenome TaxID=1076179 RepID=A0A645IRK8_9ZZZZ